MTSARWFPVRNVFACLVIVGMGQRAAAQPTVTSLNLNPTIITGGSGGTTTANVTLSAPAAPGGTALTIASSNVELAASTPSIIVPEGETTATFVVATNPHYRRYSGLAFTVTISVTNPANGSTQSATLNVTAQPRPPDVIGPDSDLTGLHCGGHPPDNGILLDCAQGPNPSTPGPCSFVEECAFGCQDLPDQGRNMNAECGRTPPFPVALTPNYVVGGNTIDGTCLLAEPAPDGAFASAQSNSPFAQTSSPVNMPFDPGATSLGFTVSTQAVGVPSFVAIVTRNVVPQPHPDGGTFFAARTGIAWLALAPPPNAPHPTLTSIVLDPSSVQECGSVQGTVTLSPAPAGAVQVFLTSDRSDIISTPLDLPFSVIVPAGATSASFTVRAGSVTADTVVNVSATVTGVTRTAALLVTNLGGPSLAGVSLNPTTVVGGNPSTGTVTLSGPAPAGGVEVRPFAGPPSIVSVPETVTVPAGQTSTTFTVTTFPVTSGTIVGVGATLGCITLSTSLVVTTPSPPAGLSSVSVNPSVVVGGEGTTGTVNLTGAAPTGGFEVALSSSDTAVATVPPTVTVPAGSASANFTVSTAPVGASTSVTITASAGGVVRTAPLTVQPFTPQTETVTFSGRIERNSTRTHTVTISTAGQGSARLSWQDNRAPLSLTVRDPSGVTIASGSGSNPLNLAFTAGATGIYSFVISNPSTREKTDYTLQVTYPVGAPAPDTTPPSVFITSPASGATVSGTINITASASDNVDVTRVEFWLNGVLLATDTTAPYSASWNTITVADGSHFLSALAFDAAGNSAASPDVVVTVSNAAPPPPSADLTVSGVPSSIRRGNFFTVTATATNTGSTSLSGLSVAVSFSPGDAFRLENPRSSSQSVPTVPANGSQSVSWSIRAERTGTATFTMTLRDSTGATLDSHSQSIVITD